MLKSSYNKKQYKLQYGKLLDYQGYENFALDRLLHFEKICEDSIITNRKDVPVIWYNDINNKRRRHYVDIYITSQNRCIEVKSTWKIKQKIMFYKNRREPKI
jgi:DNA repair protein RadC